MSILESFVSKIFLIVFGLIVIVALVVVLNKVTTPTCSPAKLFDKTGIVGFGGSFINSIYDGVCSAVLNANDAVWGAYSKMLLSLLGQRANVAAIGADLWGMGEFFCQSHSNFEYATGPEGSAITSTEDFKELFAYEVERCWTMFEGITTEPLENRNPLGKHVSFDCAEIIYDFTGGESNDYVTMAELYSKLSYLNDCGREYNAPCKVSTTQLSGLGPLAGALGTAEINYLSENMMWCAPKDLMEEYWADNKSFAPYSSFDFSGATVDEFKCGSDSLEKDDPDRLYVDSSACLPGSIAACSFSEISGYDSSSGDDESLKIDGCGKIVITYYDYFNWQSFLTYQRTGDNYEACGHVDVFNNFEPIIRKLPENWWEVSVIDLILGNAPEADIIGVRHANQILICYEKYDTDSDGDCQWE
ncbi:hypothetical protein COS64_00915 [archaeon CG06_land_8_20_14_3_00_37_11]|nr:MAG: hypothetical protein COS64_00915 [archaeon CG06_land_8_20_14_3_00_37_11]